LGRVEGKVAFVSGGASGIGAASALRLGTEGAFVYLADMNVDLARQVLEQIEAQGGSGSVLHLDVRLEDDWIAAMAKVRSGHGRLNILLNNAGVGGTSNFPTEMSLEDWRSLMSVNLDGVFLGTKHGLELMQQSDPVNGSIINISSVLGLAGAPDTGAYVASKGAVRLYTKSVALSCAARNLNIRVNSVHPGYIQTPLIENAITRRYNSEVDGMEFFDALAPIGRMGRPEEIANGVLFLASDEASYMTGSELVIDGGYTAQ